MSNERNAQYEDDFYRENEDYLKIRRRKLDEFRSNQEVNNSGEPFWM